MPPPPLWLSWLRSPLRRGLSNMKITPAHRMFIKNKLPANFIFFFFFALQIIHSQRTDNNFPPEHPLSHFNVPHNCSSSLHLYLSSDSWQRPTRLRVPIASSDLYRSSSHDSSHDLPRREQTSPKIHHTRSPVGHR